MNDILSFSHAGCKEESRPPEKAFPTTTTSTEMMLSFLLMLVLHVSLTPAERTFNTLSEVFTHAALMQPCDIEISYQVSHLKLRGFETGRNKS